MRIFVFDGSHSSLRKNFDECHQFIQNCLSNGGKVIIHCQGGVSRSATIVISFLMKFQKMRLREAFEFLKTKKGNVLPSQNFQNELNIYDKELFFPEKLESNSDLKKRFAKIKKRAVANEVEYLEMDESISKLKGKEKAKQKFSFLESKKDMRCFFYSKNFNFSNAFVADPKNNQFLMSQSLDEDSTSLALHRKVESSSSSSSNSSQEEEDHELESNEQKKGTASSTTTTTRPMMFNNIIVEDDEKPSCGPGGMAFDLQSLVPKFGSMKNVTLFNFASSEDSSADNGGEDFRPPPNEQKKKERSEK